MMSIYYGEKNPRKNEQYEEILEGSESNANTFRMGD